MLLLSFCVVAAAGCGGGGDSSTPSTPYRLVQTLPKPFGEPFFRSIALTPGGDILAISWNLSARIVRYTRQANGQYVFSAFTDRDSEAMAVSPVSGRVFSLRDFPLHNEANGWKIDVFDGMGTLLGSRLITPRQTIFSVVDIVASNRGDVFAFFLYDNGDEEIIRLNEDGNPVGSFEPEGNFTDPQYVRLAADPDGNLAVFGGEEGRQGSPLLRVYSPDGTLLRETPLEKAVGFNGLSIGSDGKLYNTGGLGPYYLGVFDYRTGERLARQTFERNALQGIAVDSAGFLYLSGGYNEAGIYRPNR